MNTKPLAPICFVKASLAIISITSSILVISTFNNFKAFTVAFNSLSSDSVIISTNSFFPSGFNSTSIGNLPINSLFNP